MITLMVMMVRGEEEEEGNGAVMAEDDDDNDDDDDDDDDDDICTIPAIELHHQRRLYLQSRQPGHAAFGTHPVSGTNFLPCRD